MPDIVEWSVYILLSLIGFLIIWFFSSQFGISEENKKYFISGYLVKVSAGAMFVLVYFLYFKVGDTFLYSQGANYLADFFWEHPKEYFKLFISSPVEAQEIVPGLLYEVPYSKETSTEEWFMVRILSVISIISFKSYLIMTYFIALLSFGGAWSFYKFFNRIFKDSQLIAFISVFLMPSVFFWSAGMLKDTFVFAAFGILVYRFSRLIEDGNFNLLINLFWVIFSTIIVFKLKSYVVILLIPCILYFLFARFKNKINNYVIRKLVSPLLLIISFGAAFFLAQIISNTTEKYKTDKLMKRAEGFHTTHSVSGSYYSLGEMEYTTVGVLKTLPAAINVSLFRPYPWEFSSVIVLISSVESVFFSGLFIFILIYYNRKIFHWFKQNNYFVLFFSFTLIFGAVVGYTSFNFGVLMRYKIPMIPFYTFILLYYFTNRNKLT